MRITTLQPQHLDFAAGLVQQEGWYGETRATFEDFLAHDPAGCFVAIQDSPGAAGPDAGRPVGLCVAVRYNRMAFIGELIVVPDQRGRGVGRALFQQALDYASPGMDLVALDADAPGIPIYQQAGFEIRTRSLRFYGQVPGREHLQVRPMTGEDLPYVIKLDLQVFGDDRGLFLYRRFKHHPELCFVTAGPADLTGYIMGRPGHGLLNVGPWVALPNLSEPGVLLERLALAVPGQKLRIAVLENQQPAVHWLRQCSGLAEGAASQRMVLDLPPNPIYFTRPLLMPAGPGDRPGMWAIGSAAKG